MQQSRALELLKDFLRFPSISTDPKYKSDITACADWLVHLFHQNEFSAIAHQTNGHPIVVAKNTHHFNRPTIMIYGHYDVQPVDPLSLWNHDPFIPVIEGDLIYARGASDDKGPVLAHILGAFEAIEQKGELPVNLTFLIEGEEEIGSPSLEQFLKEHRDTLKCDVIAISDTGMLASDKPALTYGLRGITSMHITVTGPAMDLHSGTFGGGIANPITSLAQLLATLHNKDGQIQVEGFYDAVLPLEDWEREAWATLDHDKEILQISQASELVSEIGYTPTESIWGRPTVELNGIGGGYQGPGGKTVLPASAFAKITCRLVPNQSPEHILDCLEKHLYKHLPKGVRLTIEKDHSGAPYCIDPHSKYGRAAQNALKETFSVAPALIREGGSIPIVQTFKERLGVDSLLLGLALPGCNAHSPNETFSLTNFFQGQKLNQVLLQQLANA